MTDTENETSQSSESDQPVAHPWDELRPDRFRLLRLAPLPTERDGGVRPLRFVELAQLERHTPEQSLLRLFVNIPGQMRAGKYNVLEVWADHRSKALRFGPDAGLHLEPANRGLGRFLLAQGVAWAQKRWGHYLVEGGSLPRQLSSDDQRLRRDHCLRTQGFDVVYAKEQTLQSTYGASRVSALRPDWNSEKVQIVELQDAAAMLEQADRNLQAQDNQIRELQERIAHFRREDGSLRFTIVCLIALTLFQAGLLIWIATR
ncbi:hypothetical protein GFL09_08115 [Pseudomonas stutzeri]|uniref:Uncharacterized protein n=1 Tax=Stutzerimonas stutzeri KOS6 TaxID=1218352 RepID=A0A061JQU4_STUST|nr:hypothetical protein [Stutzerimonas stutzeri]EWC40549.1 hypothetical protein B597_014700 [Stutzerimonas stutzeri KOS6]MBK3867655.1 hypothetical protein [Stutzerimonas stutzeri]